MIQDLIPSLVRFAVDWLCNPDNYTRGRSSDSMVRSMNTETICCFHFDSLELSFCCITLYYTVALCGSLSDR